MSQLNGKTILVTGATSGIGRETAVGLAQMGAHVIVTGRNRERGEQGVADIRARSGNNNVDLMLADMSSMAEVRRMASEFQAQYDRLDVLINNVGYLASERKVTDEGMEMMFAVNSVAWFVLTNELMPLLKQSAPSRVINVTGGMPGGSDINFDNIQAEQGYEGLASYTQTKKVMMAASYAFAKQLAGSGVALNVAYPGAAGTNMTENLNPSMLPLPMRLIYPVFQLILATSKPENAAVSSIYLASSPEVAGANGNYYNTKAKQVPWPPNLVKMGVPERCLQITEEWAQKTVQVPA